MEISILYRRGYKQKDIVLELGIRKDIVSKELKRNSVINRDTWESEYIGSKAQMKSYQRRRWAKHQSMKLMNYTPLKKYVVWELKQKVPPKTIAHNWNKKENEIITITHGSIYKWLETWDGNKHKKYLLHQYSGYKKKTQTKKVIIPQRVGIEERPVLIDERQGLWHYEADLIVSKKGYKWVLLTLIDRHSRKWLVLKLKDKTTKWVMNAIVKYRKQLWIESITFDNGREFSHHYKLWKHNIQTYFCNPYSSWEKWSVENYNRIIRRWFPILTPNQVHNTSM